MRQPVIIYWVRQLLARLASGLVRHLISYLPAYLLIERQLMILLVVSQSASYAA
jgi:hypothetical protein